MPEGKILTEPPTKGGQNLAVLRLDKVICYHEDRGLNSQA